MKLGVTPRQMPGSETKTGRGGFVSRGFTLVEVLCAVAISGLIFIGLFYGISQGYNLIQTARSNLRATQIMVGKVEGLRLCSWTQITNTSIVPTSFMDYFYPIGTGGGATNSVVYGGTITVDNVPFSAGYASAMKQITVSVNWTNFNAGKAVPFSRTFQTYVAQYGLQNYVY